MKSYDLIAIGTGSAMNLVEPYRQLHPQARIAVIDKDPPGGICLTKGCIPTKMLVYPAEILRMLDTVADLGIDVTVERIDFPRIMERMRSLVAEDVSAIREGLSRAEGIDYYPETATFTAPYRLAVGRETITSELILLCTGSRPGIPDIENLDAVSYHTSDTILELTRLPPSIAIIGGGYIAAEYAHFFSAMGSKVAVIGRNPAFLPHEEPEVGALVFREMSERMMILPGHEATAVDPMPAGKKRILARETATGKERKIIADEILVATGRSANTDLLRPEQGGISCDGDGWIRVNAHLETTSPGVWALGDATGHQMFKHVANHESKVVFHNAVLGERLVPAYHAVPHAVFSFPEVAAVGMTEEEAAAARGKGDIRIGFQHYRDTARRNAMGAKHYFAKVIVEADTERILGAHVVGPQASVLIQELVTLMYTEEKSIIPVTEGMHIHPALSEVVERACINLLSVEAYHHLLRHRAG